MKDLKGEILKILHKYNRWELTTAEARDSLLVLFNRWLREQDARNPDGDELRLEEE